MKDQSCNFIFAAESFEKFKMIYNTGKCINVKYENIKILCTLLCHIMFATFLVYHSEGPA